MLSYSHALWTIPAIAGDYLDDGAVDDYGDNVMILAVMMVMMMIMMKMIMLRKPMLMALRIVLMLVLLLAVITMWWSGR